MPLTVLVLEVGMCVCRREETGPPPPLPFTVAPPTLGPGPMPELELAPVLKPVLEEVIEREIWEGTVALDVVGAAFSRPAGTGGAAAELPLLLALGVRPLTSTAAVDEPGNSDVGGGVFGGVCKLVRYAGRLAAAGGGGRDLFITDGRLLVVLPLPWVVLAVKGVGGVMGGVGGSRGDTVMVAKTTRPCPRARKRH